MRIDKCRGVERRREPRGGRRAADPRGRAPRVIIADPYDGARRPTAQYLLRHGFDVLEASNAAQTIAAFGGCPPRVLLTGLLDDDADRLYRHVIVTPRTSLLVVLLNAGAESVAPFTPAAVIAKPFPLPAMLRRLRDVLATRGRLAEGN